MGGEAGGSVASGAVLGCYLLAAAAWGIGTGAMLGLLVRDWRRLVCLRRQAALTQPFGLRQFFAATTTFRRYYDRLPADPMADDDDPAVAIARPGLQRAQSGPWSSILALALLRTRTIAECVLASADQSSLWSTYEAANDR